MEGLLSTGPTPSSFTSLPLNNTAPLTPADPLVHVAPLSSDAMFDSFYYKNSV